MSNGPYRCQMPALVHVQICQMYKPSNFVATVPCKPAHAHDAAKLAYHTLVIQPPNAVRPSQYCNRPRNLGPPRATTPRPRVRRAEFTNSRPQRHRREKTRPV